MSEAKNTDLGADASPNALRGLDILMAVARHRGGVTFTSLRDALDLPKASMHRLLKTLVSKGYLVERSGQYFLDAQSTLLAGLISRATHHGDFPASVVPVAEWLARETGESVVVGILTERLTEVVYVHVVNSDAPLRITVPVGNRRPLYSAASGKAILSFMPADFRERYLSETRFEKVTPFTTSAAELPEILQRARRDGIAADINGSFIGVIGLASPGMDAAGNVFCAISVVGPIERMEASGERTRALTLEASVARCMQTCVETKSKKAAQPLRSST
jgi:DNA-binding IclR family transcriptional regulator